MITSQRQAVIKLSETKDKDKRLLSNYIIIKCRYKFISKVFCFQIKKTYFKSYLISTNRICCTKRCINESGRLISDLLGITEKMKIKGYLVTSAIEKASNFLVSTLEKFGFNKNFKRLNEIFLKEQ